MPESVDMAGQMRGLIDERLELERRLQNEKGELSNASRRDYETSYGALQRKLITLIKQAGDESQRVTLMLELMRILENRLVYLQNFLVDPTNDHRILASLVTKFIDGVSLSHPNALTNLESIYFRAIGALYAGDLAVARQGFRAACESEESDEANDIKYKSYVILGHISHEEHDYAHARELHDRSLQYSHNANVTAQALAFKALNVYALNEYDEALQLFESALAMFDGDQPFFNSYFFRNSLIFCGSIYFDRKDYGKAQEFYERVVREVEPHSYDSFDALSHLGKILFHLGRFDEAARRFEEAIASHKFSDNEYLVDTCFWVARTHMKRGANDEARKYLERITASDVVYEKKGQAAQMLQRFGV